MPRIVVVDDDSAILESLQYLLEDAGYEVEVFEDGRFIHALSDRIMPDLIILDYWLPGENGGVITEKLKNNQETRDIPVVIISASYNIQELVEKVGADDYIPKPYDIDQILDKCRQYVGPVS